MESALSIVTTSYLSTEDFVKSIRENLPYINAPIRDTFEAFLTQADIIDANIISSINTMKLRTQNDIFHEWCDCIIQCQSDRSMKYLDENLDEHLYVCSRYPECDSYVGVHKGTTLPKGTLANSELRNK